MELNIFSLAALIIIFSGLLILLVLLLKNAGYSVPSTNRFVLLVTAGIFLGILISLTLGNGFFLYLYLGPGLVFGIAIALCVPNEEALFRFLFIMLSGLLYYLMVMASLTGAYWVPLPEYLAAASITGAVALTLLFCLLFGCFRYITVVEILLIMISALSLLAVTGVDKLGITGIIPWQLGMAYAFQRIYLRKERSLQQAETGSISPVT